MNGPESGEDDAAEVAALQADHPAWAIWLPIGGRWTGVRSAGSRPAGPDLPLLWAQAATAEELASKMQTMDEQASAGGWP